MGWGDRQCSLAHPNPRPASVPRVHSARGPDTGLPGALRPEVAPFGIRVALIEPGAVRTRFLANSEPHQPGNDGDSPHALYKANVDTMTARAHRDGARGVLEPDDVARAIVMAVTARRPKTRYKVGPQARLAPLARRILGDRGWDAFMRRMVPFPAPP